MADTDTTEKLKRRAQNLAPKGWDVFHAAPYVPPEPFLGEYRAHRYIDNGTLVEVVAHTPEGLAEAAKLYDQGQRNVEAPEERAARLRAEELRAAEIAAAARPTTEQELAELAIEVQPVALAEKVATEGADSVTADEREKAGVSEKGGAPKGASIIPPGATPESAAAVTGVQPKTSKTKGK